MSSNIAPTNALPPAATGTPVGSAAYATGRQVAAGSDEAAVRLDTIPSSPPPELRDEIMTASRAADRLAARGQHLHFEFDPGAGHFSVQVLDAKGALMFEVPPRQVLEIAAGGDLHS
jgi:hypothetical protein